MKLFQEQECLELRKEREKNEVQLQSGTIPKEARGSQAGGLRYTHPSVFSGFTVSIFALTLNCGICI